MIEMRHDPETGERDYVEVVDHDEGAPFHGAEMPAC
jgi:hypothetical protein